MDEKESPNVRPTQQVPPKAPSAPPQASTIPPQLEHATTLIDDGAAACEEMRSLGYEFGMERELQIKVSFFIDRLTELAELLANASCSDSANVADSLGEPFGRLLGRLQADKSIVNDVREHLSEPRRASDSLLDLYRRYAAQFLEVATTLEAVVRECRERRARLRHDVEFGDGPME